MAEERNEKWDTSLFWGGFKEQHCPALPFAIRLFCSEFEFCSPFLRRERGDLFEMQRVQEDPFKKSGVKEQDLATLPCWMGDKVGV